MGASASVQETATALEKIGKPYMVYANKIREYDVGVADLLEQWVKDGQFIIFVENRV